MFRVRAIARRHAAALAVVFCAVATPGMAMGRPAPPTNATPVSAENPADLTPVEKQHAEALAEYGTGVAEEIRGNSDEALEHYQHALQLAPENAMLAGRLVQSYLSRRDITN